MLKVFLAVFLLISLVQTVAAQPYQIDYEYAPAYWLTPIGFVDDWQKSLVDNRGRLAYDFGPGPYVRPKTTIEIRRKGADQGDVVQTILDARVPVVVSESSDDDYSLSTYAFSLVPDEFNIPDGIGADGAYVRTSGLTGSVAWIPASENVDPSFQSVAWGTGRSIHYRIRVESSGKRRLAFGFNDIYRSGRISRAMDIHADGSEPLTIDLLQSAPQGTPQVFFLDAVDDDGDGWIDIDIAGSREALDPNTFVNAIWVFPASIQITEDEVVRGDANDRAELHINCGTLYLEQKRLRQDALRARLDGPGELEVVVNSTRPLRYEASSGDVLFDAVPFIRTLPEFTDVRHEDDAVILTFAPGTKSVDVLVTNGRGDAGRAFPDLDAEQEKTTRYWDEVDLPFGRIQVPDQEMQRLLDGSIRTLYQIRDVADGYAQFQPGPSVYRGLWYVDGGWAVETAAFLGDNEAARQTIAALALHQDSTGRAGVIMPPLLHRETAHLIYIVCRYARLTQEWDWLDANWSSMVAAMNHIAHLRQQASEDRDALYYGLLPPGLTDGGIGGVGSTYGSTYWALIAVAEAVRTAEQLGKPQAAEWRAEYEDFLASFRAAQKRDQQADDEGNVFLPLKMDFDPASDIPQRGQWGLIHSLYAGQFLDPDEPIVRGTLAMLESRTIEDHVHSLGWLDGGIWPIFEAHRAIAYNYVGEPDNAERLLYAFANHASPTFAWVEEQMPKGKGTRTTGDVPHTMGNLQVVRLIRFLLITERGDDVHLLEGLPLTWLRPGANTQIVSTPTLKGPISMRIKVDDDGRSGSVWVQTPGQPTSGSVRLDTRRLKKAGYTFGESDELPDTIEVPWGTPTRIEFNSELPATVE
ncbi:MAG: hypothetical protein HKN43_04860 [Rhodothermales bacterium]|nr:hypothetical protein [Rhodothermales bacterium]